jgi:cyclic pyranopterin phosphate synthase
MPDKPFSWVPKENLLSFEEMFGFVKAAIDEGITKIRITGGEPTLREDLDKFIAMIYNYRPDIDIAMTTNGFLLSECAESLAKAGLKRINISLDSLRSETAKQIAGGKDVLYRVLKGIDAALKVGFKVKLNTVPLKGVNDDELLDIMEYAKERGAMLRFIEFMENTHAAKSAVGLSSDEILSIIGQKYEFEEIQKEFSSPARLYQMKDGYKFGVIEPHKEDFCDSCNRLRLTAEGYLIPCLYFDEALSIKDAVKAGDIPAAIEIFKKVIKNKPQKNRWSGEDAQISGRAFYMTGG